MIGGFILGVVVTLFTLWIVLVSSNRFLKFIIGLALDNNVEEEYHNNVRNIKVKKNMILNMVGGVKYYKTRKEAEKVRVNGQRIYASVDKGYWIGD